MKLLFDANLSPKLVGHLAELFPGSAHVFDTCLARFTPDENIWEYARANGFTIVTADSDFVGLAKSRGAPPKVIHLENCNYRTSRLMIFCDDMPFGSRNWNSPRELRSSSEVQPESVTHHHALLKSFR